MIQTELKTENTKKCVHRYYPIGTIVRYNMNILNANVLCILCLLFNTLNDIEQ